MQLPLPWERILWSRRDPLAPWRQYALTDFRLVHVGWSHAHELALHDIGDVQRRRSWTDRLLGTSTLIVHARRARHGTLVLSHLRRGAQLAALLDLLSGDDPHTTWDPASIKATLEWAPTSLTNSYGRALAGTAAVILALIGVAIGLPGKAAAISYAPDDAIYPGGVKNDRATVVRFMESVVMPWARRALAPLAGGPDRVTCETCHGLDAQARRWEMPAVAALPQPDVIFRGWERYGGAMDPQIRNAIYGYIAESDNQTKAAYMREVVMPGMARLLHRPAYDFTRSYDYNRSHAAFGCYHCHKVK